VRAHVYHEEGAPWSLEEVPTPRPGPGGVQIKVQATGVCGSDLHLRYGRGKPYTTPLILGHEIAGVVSELGESAAGVEVGDRVCIHYVTSCGRCRWCNAGHDNRCRNRRSIGSHLNGGFAEYIVVPDRNAFKLPDSVPIELGAILGCAVSTAYHALRFARLEPGEAVAVFGLGGVGLHAVTWAKALGATLVVGVDNMEAKLKAAEAFGADVALHSEHDDAAETIRSLTDGYGADVAVECAGHPVCMKAAIDCVHGKSRYESGRTVGVALFSEEVILPEAWTFREGGFLRAGDHTRDDLRQVIDLVASGRVDLSGSVTHRFPFDQLEAAMQLIENREEPVVRAVIMAEE